MVLYFLHYLIPFCIVLFLVHFINNQIFTASLACLVVQKNLKVENILNLSKIKQN